MPTPQKPSVHPHIQLMPPHPTARWIRKSFPSRHVRLLLALASALALACGPRPAAAPSPAVPDGPPRIVGYLFGSGGRAKDSVLASLDGSKLTHVIYAFANISPEGAMILGNRCRDVGVCDSTAALPDTLGGHFAALMRLRQRYPRLRVLISVGGWTWSGRFSDIALTDSTRRVFVASAVELFLHRWPGLFDGFDVDWEYPGGGGMVGNAARPEDGENFTLLLAELRRQLDAEGSRSAKKYLLTIATGAHAPRGRGIQFDAVAPLVDWINVMTYDFHGGSPIANFNAPLHSPPHDPTPTYNVDSSVAMYIAAGVPREKIVVGVPFYGRLFGGVQPANDGMLQPALSPPPADVSAGGMDYRSLVARRLDTLGFRRHWEKTAQVPWLYNPATGAWITYDDPQSLAAKADYVRANALGGIMIWELGGDDGTLVRTIRDHLQ